MLHYVYRLYRRGTQELLYIGRSNNPIARKNDFERKTGILVEQRIRAFLSLETACAGELEAIKNNWPPFNTNLVSSRGSVGRKHSETERARIRDRSLGKKASEATRARQRAAKLGKLHGPMSAEQKAKISCKLKGHAVSDETRRKIGEKSKGRAISLEQREKIRQSLKRTREAAKHESS